MTSASGSDEILDYDVIIVGAGHAGTEAALASARLGCRTLCLTSSIDNVAHMPCNPSIGGPAKGHLVREIDALGGQMAIATDSTLIQLKMLNTSKGPAVRAMRAQVDKLRYHLAMKRAMEVQEGLYLRQLMVERLHFKRDSLQGVVCSGGLRITAPVVILTTGTYLGGRIFVGSHSHEGGPNGQLPSTHLSGSLREMGIAIARFKTGTPPRLNGRSIDFAKMALQPGDDIAHGFSFMRMSVDSMCKPCYLTYTNAGTHDMIRGNLECAPMFSGAISGKGPRYCPSIEAKVMTFPEKDRHQLFIEPEGLNSEEFYLAGFSTSLPETVQDKMIHTIPGLERAEVLRYGYAIEYDVILTYQLSRWLEHKDIPNLFCAGQINGTSGYEEAAAQGLLAGVNAARRVKGMCPAVIARHEAYIGVLVDDLVTKAPEEPYRIMTTMAEHRMVLRHDNADTRLTPMGRSWGLVTDERMKIFEDTGRKVEEELERLAGVGRGKERLVEQLKRPENDYESLSHLDPERPELPKDVVERVQIALKYEGYIARQEKQVERVRKYESRSLIGVDMTAVPGLSSEAREKLIKVRPDTLGQAARVAGVSAADVTSLMLYIARRGVRRGGA